MSDRSKVVALEHIKTSFIESMCNEADENWDAFIAGAAALKAHGLGFVESFRTMAEWLTEARLVIDDRYVGPGSSA